jgi:hypothetical protein
MRKEAAMTRFLVSEDNPAGRKLEDILLELRADVIMRRRRSPTIIAPKRCM